MAEPTITKGEDYFFVTTYEGNGGGQKVGNFIPFTDSGTIAKSCLFNNNTNNYLSRTPGSNGSTTTLTFSAWVKRSKLGSQSSIFFTNDFSTYGEQLEFLSNDTLQYVCTRTTPGVNDWNFKTNRTFEDTSKWYHIFIKRDTTNSTQADRVQIYVDGERITSFSTETLAGSSAPGWWNQTTFANIMGNTGNGSYLRGIGYLAEVNMIDGTAMDVSDFGVTDTSTGRWVPKTLTGITYGTNGFRMEFANTAGQTIGDDTSGNGNDFTVTNLDANDIHLDTPTDLFPTLADFQASYGGNYDKGNLELDGSTNAQTSTGRSTLSFDVEDSTGYYFEFRNMGTVSFGSNFNGYGITGVNADNIAPSSGALYPNGGHYVTLQEDGNVRINVAGSLTSLGGSTLPKTGNTSTRDTIGCAVKSGKVWFSKNGIWGNANQGNPNSDGTPIASGLTGRFRAAAFCYDDNNSLQEVNFGQRLTLGGSATSDYSANNGGYFLYPPPSGFRAIKQDNLSTTEKGIPDLVWIKNRDAADSHQLYDSSRGVQKDFNPDSTAAESTTTDGLQKFLKGGCQIEDDVSINTSGESYVAWNWIVNGGTTSANTDGSGATLASTIQVNQTAGFSIVQYTGNATAGAKVAHGLSTKPDLIFLRRKDYSGSWYTYHSAEGATKYGFLEVSTAFGTASTVWNNTEPTSSVFTLSQHDTNTNTYNYIAYCWHSVEGFSHFGSYIGNANTNGPFVYTGFKPSWLLIKNASATASWFIVDNKRNTFNPVENWLVSDDPQAEVVTSGNRKIDFLSNGFKIRATTTDYNGSGNKIIYMAFAEHPFIGSSSISPATAR